MVSLEALENILKCGKEHFVDNNGDNMFTLVAEQSGLIDKLEELQMHKNHLVYERTVSLLETYF